MDMITGLSRQVWAALGVSVFIGALFFKLIFGDFQGFVECVRYWFQPDFVSFVRGEWMEDKWGSLKLFGGEDNRSDSRAQFALRVSPTSRRLELLGQNPLHTSCEAY